MNLKNTLFLLVLFAALGIYVYFVEFKQHDAVTHVLVGVEFDLFRHRVDTFGTFRLPAPIFLIRHHENRFTLSDLTFPDQYIQLFKSTDLAIQFLVRTIPFLPQRGAGDGDAGIDHGAAQQVERNRLHVEVH